MPDTRALALETTQRIRASAGVQSLAPAERAALEQNLARLETALGYGARAADPYAAALDSPVERFNQQFSGAPQASPPPQAAPQPAPPPAGASGPAMLDAFGRRAAEALEAIDFPTFVAGLVTGTFKAIVDASAQQIR